LAVWTGGTVRSQESSPVLRGKSPEALLRGTGDFRAEFEASNGPECLRVRQNGRSRDFGSGLGRGF
jgi:hypothetical protein